MDRFCAIALSCLIGLLAVQARDIDSSLSEEWESFKIKYNKTYRSQVEEKFRKMVFIENWHKIERHNRKYQNDEVSFGMAMNSMGDLLHHEIVATRQGLIRKKREDTSNYTTFLLPENVEVPSAINWVKKGFVTGVKNQGDCGSCWAFSATGTLEGQHKRKTGKLISLSEQNLVDCSSKFGNYGCDGGFPSSALKYVKANKGIDKETAYPYEGVDGKCRFKKSEIGATDTGVVMVKTGSEKKLREAVGTVGPVSVCIDASKETFDFYSEGIYDEPECSTEDLSHAVLAVGYAAYKGKEYWLVKNSWGTDWGINGYIRMSRNKKNQCGIATDACYPLV